MSYASTFAVALSGAYSLGNADDGKTFYCTAALTLTVPAGLALNQGVIVLPPSSGNLSIASSGTTLNGATTTLTRSRANNVVGVSIVPYADTANAFGVSGS